MTETCREVIWSDCIQEHCLAVDKSCLTLWNTNPFGFTKEKEARLFLFNCPYVNGIVMRKSHCWCHLDFVSGRDFR